jgi:O-6-methylguanine DNA methyltransferase
MPHAPAFQAAVLAVVRRIPPGRIATYGDVAAMAGRPRAARAVGNIMRECRDSGVPCHRVVGAGGALGGYAGNLELKRGLLRAEGILVFGRRIRSFSAARWFGAPRRSANGRDASRLAHHRHAMPVGRGGERLHH